MKKHIEFELDEWEMMFAQVELEQEIKRLDECLQAGSCVARQLELTRETMSKIYTAIVQAGFRR